MNRAEKPKVSKTNSNWYTVRFIAREKTIATTEHIDNMAFIFILSNVSSVILRFSLKYVVANIILVEKW